MLLIVSVRLCISKQAFYFKHNLVMITDGPCVQIFPQSSFNVY